MRIFAAFLLLFFVNFNAYAEDGPKCTQDDSWEFAVNNAYRLAEEYAMNKKPESGFLAFHTKKIIPLRNRLKGNIKISIC